MSGKQSIIDHAGQLNTTIPSSIPKYFRTLKK